MKGANVSERKSGAGGAPDVVRAAAHEPRRQDQALRTGSDAPTFGTMADLLDFASCPIASRFIDDATGARAYYLFRLVGDHRFLVGEVEIVVRFNAEEIHLFTRDSNGPFPASEIVRRGGGAKEARRFDLVRARALDLVLPTLQRPVKALRAKDPRCVQLIGPADGAGHRLNVIVCRAAPMYVRTSFVLTPTDFQRAVRSTPGATWPWPEK